MEPFYQDSQFTQWTRDNLEVLAQMQLGSVDAIMTSPPYFGLRVYKAPAKIFDNHNGCNHQWGEQVIRSKGHPGTRSTLVATQTATLSKEANSTGQFCVSCNAWRGQLGCEPQPDLFIKHLCDTFDACKRVLKSTGSLWVNLKDSYASTAPGTMGDIIHKRGILSGIKRETGEARRNFRPSTGVMPKSLIGIPERFVLEMQRRGWCRRNTIIWHKRNVMPQSVKDRFTEDFEYLYMFTLSNRYFFEQQFENMAESSRSRLAQDIENQTGSDRIPGKTNGNMKAVGNLSLGRNMRTVWTINTKGSGIRHFATFPPTLCTTPILASVPEFICTKCGRPRIRLYEQPKGPPASWKGSKFDEGKNLEVHPEVGRREDAKTETAYPKGSTAGRLALLRQQARANGGEYANAVTFKGLSDCGCDAPFESGVILDLFGGTATVALEARRLARRAVCIDISEEYSKVAVEKVTALPNPFDR